MGEFDQVYALCNTNPFMNHNHIQLIQVARDVAVTQVTVTDELQNPYTFAHGGVLYTLADCASGSAARTDGRSYVTMSSAFHFLHSGSGGDTIQAKAQVRRRGKNTCYVETDLTDSKGNLVATGAYTFFCIDGTRSEE